jgi:hypothetical protein
MRGYFSFSVLSLRGGSDLGEGGIIKMVEILSSFNPLYRFDSIDLRVVFLLQMRQERLHYANPVKPISKRLTVPPIALKSDKIQK